MLGVVAGALAADELVQTALAGLPDGLGVRVTDGAAVLAGGPGGPTVTYARLGGRTWRVSLAPATASPLAPLGIVGAGLALMLTLLVASLRVRRASARSELQLL